MFLLSLQDAELSFLHMLRNASNNFLDALFEVITFLGEQYVIVLIVAILFFAIDKKKTEKLIYSVFFSILLNGVVKLFVARTRPFSVENNPVIPARQETATGYSFPSGHTQNAAVTYTSCALFLKKKWSYIAAPIIIILIGFSRLWLGVHYPTDVLVGCLLGVGCAFLGYYIMSKVENNFKHKMITYLITLGVFLPFIIYFFITMHNRMKAFPLEEDLKQTYRLYKDIFTGFGIFVGFVGATFLEHKFVDFDCNCSTKTKVLRLVVGLPIIGGFYLLLNIIFKAINPYSVLLDMIRYFVVAFIGLGVYPVLFRNTFLFKKEQVTKEIA